MLASDSAKFSLWHVVKSRHYKDERAIKAFGNKVRELRIATGMTIEDFANTMDLHVTMLARIERGETNPTISTIFLIAEKLGVSASSLIAFGDEENKMQDVPAPC